MSYKLDGDPVGELGELTSKDTLLGTDEGSNPASFTLDAICEAIYKWIGAKESSLTPTDLGRRQLIRGFDGSGQRMLSSLDSLETPDFDITAGHRRGGSYRMVAQKAGETNIKFSSLRGEDAYITYKNQRFTTSPFAEQVDTGDVYTLTIPSDAYLEDFWCTDAITNADLTGIDPCSSFKVGGPDLVIKGDLTGIHPYNDFTISGWQLDFSGDLSDCRPLKYFKVYGSTNGSTCTGDMTGLNPIYSVYIKGANFNFTGDISTFRGEEIRMYDVPGISGDGDKDNPDLSGFQGFAFLDNCPLMINWVYKSLVYPADGSMMARREGPAHVEFKTASGGGHVLFKGVEYPSPFQETVEIEDRYKIVVPAGDTLEYLGCFDKVSAGILKPPWPTVRLVLKGNNLYFGGDLTECRPSQHFIIDGQNCAFRGDLSNTRPSLWLTVNSRKCKLEGDLTGLDPMRRLYINAPLCTFTGDITGTEVNDLGISFQETLAGDGTGFEGTQEVRESPLMVNWGNPAPVELAPTAADLADVSKWTVNAVMTDDFEGGTLDAAKWHDTNPTWRGRKPSFFQAENVKQTGGELVLTAKITNDTLPDGYHTYGCAAVKSLTKVKYGYFEMECRPMRSRVTSAWWFYNNEEDDTPGDPNNHWTEIDVFEMDGTQIDLESSFPMAAHLFYNPEIELAKNIAYHHVHSLKFWKAAYDFVDDYHVIGLLWEADYITWFVDGVKTWKIKNVFWHRPLTMNFDCEVFPWKPKILHSELPSEYNVKYVKSWTRV